MNNGQFRFMMGLVVLTMGIYIIHIVGAIALLQILAGAFLAAVGINQMIKENKTEKKENKPK